MKIKKPVKLSLPKQISNEIENAIKNGEFQIGDKIPSEPDLVKTFGVSRNTIREAIQSLIQAGVLESRQGNGTYVMSLGRFEANILNKLNNSNIREVNEVRFSLETEIVKFAAQRRTEADLIKLRETLENRHSVKESIKEDSKADVEFHMAIAEACHNTIFIDLYRSISQFISNSIEQRGEFKELNEEFDKLHIELFEAIELKDSKKLKKLLLKF